MNDKIYIESEEIINVVNLVCVPEKVQQSVLGIRVRKG